MSTKVDLRDKEGSEDGVVHVDEPTGGKVPQILSAMIINILAMGVGASYGIPNVFYLQLDPQACNGFDSATPIPTNSPSTISGPSASMSTELPVRTFDCPFTIDSDEKSLISLSGVVGMYTTLFFAVPIVSKFGKRISMMIDCVLSLVAFIFMASAQNVGMLVISKFLLGYVSLTCRSAIQPFICETSNPNIRGFTTAFYILFYISGQAFSTFLAGRNQTGDDGWRWTAAVFAGLMVICFLSLLLWIHESPDWLLDQRRFSQATKALEFFKIDREILVADESKRKTIDGRHKSYKEIVSLYEEAAALVPKKESKRRQFAEKVKEKTKAVINTFKRPEVYKPFILLTVILMMTDLSGFVVMANFSSTLIAGSVQTVMVNGTQIEKERGFGYGEDTFVDALTFVTIIQVTRIPSSFLAMGILGKFRKRPVYMCAAFSLLFMVGTIIVFTFLLQDEDFKQNFKDNVGLQVVPLILFILFYATFSFGYGNVPFSLMGELFPPNASSIANTGVFIISNLGSIVALQTALVIDKQHGLPYVFFMPAAAIVGNIIIAFFFMPETFGLTIEEVREIYGEKVEDTAEKVEEKEQDDQVLPTIQIDQVPIDDEEDEEELPYYHTLRSQVNIELMCALKQRKSVFAWPSAGGGALQVQTIQDSSSPQKGNNSRVSSYFAF